MQKSIPKHQVSRNHVTTKHLERFGDTTLRKIKFDTVGANRLTRMGFFMDIIVSPLMVIYEIHVVSVASLESKHDAGVAENRDWPIDHLSLPLRR
jgi:hypothetical protein